MSGPFLFLLLSGFNQDPAKTVRTIARIRLCTIVNLGCVRFYWDATENIMSKLFSLVAAIGFVIAATTPGSAQYYGYRPYYAPPPPPYYGGYYAPRAKYKYYGRKRNPCPPYWTVQSGVCKPYRGY